MTENKNGISVITCSIKPELCNQMLESVKGTIGINFETIVFDNREKNYGICKVYNDCAKKAKYPYLCFIHEDVILPTPNWGASMVSFAEKTQNCGVIGFAGGTVARRNFIYWEGGEKGRYRFFDPTIPLNKKEIKVNNGLILKYNNPENEKFAKVVTLDGVFLFVKKEIWEKFPFDEEKIKDFHFYDADFSLNIAQKYKNYVCLIADIYHFSSGNLTKKYFEYARIFQKKWKHILPYCIEKQKVTFTDELKGAKDLFILSMKHGFTFRQCTKHLIKNNSLFFFYASCVFIPACSLKKIISNIIKV